MIAMALGSTVVFNGGASDGSTSDVVTVES